MNKHIERMAELVKEVLNNETLGGLPTEQVVAIAHGVIIEENQERRHQERSKGYSRPLVTAASKPAHGDCKPSATPTIPGLDNVSKDLTGKLEIKKETEKGSIICSVGGTEFWIFPSAATLLTNAKFYKGAEVKARIQERAFKDGKKYWLAIGLDVNPGDDIS